MHARGQIAPGQERTFQSIISTSFAGSVASLTTAGPHQAIAARVSGRAFYSGSSEFTVEADDPLAQGFVLR